MVGGDQPVRSDQPGDMSREGGLRQISLRRLKEFDIRPKRDLGQNFLIDDNILEVIMAQLEARSDDVILEVGAGLGVLTRVLAGAASLVHAFEIDRSLQPALEATLSGCTNVRLHYEDVLRARLCALDPPPTLCASNLPYSVAGPLLIESLRKLPSIRRYCVMVQREVADRIAAPPGSKTYGTLSVWVQLYAEVLKTRPLARSIFYPQPHVDSSLVVLNRRAPERLPDCDPEVLRAVIQAAFGQRRKTLANALAAGPAQSKQRAETIFRDLGLQGNIRAEALAPEQFVAVAKRLT
jgi:16S rRNA (adenine1518-N6/adenine1519-N6)-dimethyltransferase